MDKEQWKVAILERMDELVEIVAKAICENENPVGAERVLRALAALLASEGPMPIIPDNDPNEAYNITVSEQWPQTDE